MGQESSKPSNLTTDGMIAAFQSFNYRFQWDNAFRTQIQRLLRNQELEIDLKGTPEEIDFLIERLQENQMLKEKLSTEIAVHMQTLTDYRKNLPLMSPEYIASRERQTRETHQNLISALKTEISILKANTEQPSGREQELENQLAQLRDTIAEILDFQEQEKEISGKKVEISSENSEILRLKQEIFGLKQQKCQLEQNLAVAQAKIRDSYVKNTQNDDVIILKLKKDLAEMEQKYQKECLRKSENSGQHEIASLKSSLKIADFNVKKANCELEKVKEKAKTLETENILLIREMYEEQAQKDRKRIGELEDSLKMSESSYAELLFTLETESKNFRKMTNLMGMYKEKYEKLEQTHKSNWINLAMTPLQRRYQEIVPWSPAPANYTNLEKKSQDVTSSSTVPQGTTTVLHTTTVPQPQTTVVHAPTVPQSRTTVPQGVTTVLHTTTVPQNTVTVPQGSTVLPTVPQGNTTVCCDASVIKSQTTVPPTVPQEATVPQPETTVPTVPPTVSTIDEIKKHLVLSNEKCLQMLTQEQERLENLEFQQNLKIQNLKLLAETQNLAENPENATDPYDLEGLQHDLCLITDELKMTRLKMDEMEKLHHQSIENVKLENLKIFEKILAILPPTFSVSEVHEPGKEAELGEEKGAELEELESISGSEISWSTLGSDDLD